MNNLYLEVYETLASILFPEIFMLITIGRKNLCTALRHIKQNTRIA